MTGTGTLAVALGLGLPLLALALLLMWRSPVTFLVLLVLSRLLLDSASQYTYAELAPGITIVKLYSIGMTLLMGAYLLHRRRLELMPWGAMAAILIAAALVGTVLTASWGGFANVALRWIYVWLMAYLALYAAQHSSPPRIAALLLLVLLYPMANVAVMGALYGPGDLDAGQVSYQGSFGHESQLGYMCLAAIAFSFGLLATVRDPLQRALLVTMMLIAHAVLFYANYRTSLVAAMAFWLVMLLYLFPRLSAAMRVNLLLFGGIALGVVLFRLGPEIALRMADLGTLLYDPGQYFDASTYQDESDDNLMSGRVAIINRYMYFYMQAPIELKIAGLGPESGTDLVGKYAHNEYIGTLVEQGVIGITALIGMLIAGFVIVRKAARRGDWMTRSMAGMLAGIVTMSLGTMPFRDARGIMFLGIALGLVEWSRRYGGKRVADEAQRRIEHPPARPPWADAEPASAAPTNPNPR